MFLSTPADTTTEGYDSDLAGWIAGQCRVCTTALAEAISARQLVRRRPAFGQEVIPAPGSVLASPVAADWDPEPDYFFHWIRDSAIAMRTVAELMEDAEDPAERARWQRCFEDFIRFSLKLCSLDGPAFPRGSGHREATRPESLKHLAIAESRIQ